MQRLLNLNLKVVRTNFAYYLCLEHQQLKLDHSEPDYETQEKQKHCYFDYPLSTDAMSLEKADRICVLGLLNELLVIVLCLQIALLRELSCVLL